MSANPLVTIIIPCYNYGAFIHDALKSLIWQTYPHWECIVINDGSTDITQEVVLEFAKKDRRIKYIYQNNEGVSAARNKALKGASGKYIQLLDADDLLEPDKLQLHVALLEENSSIDLVYGKMSFFKKHFTENSELYPFKIKAVEPTSFRREKTVELETVSGKGEVLIKALIEDNFFVPGCTLARKSLYDEVGPFKKGIEGIEDWHYWYRAALLQKEFYHDEQKGTALLVRIHGANASGNQFKMLRGRIRAREDLMAITNTLLHNNTILSKQFLNAILQMHKTYLSRDKFIFHLLFGNMLIGIKNNIRYAYYSRKPLYAVYNGAHWVKERIKNYKRIPA